MTKPTLYKKSPLSDARGRGSVSLTSAEDTAAKLTISKFWELFRTRHLS
jgi:hypothetical protein